METTKASGRGHHASHCACHRQERKKGGYTQVTCQLQGHASGAWVRHIIAKGRLAKQKRSLAVTRKAAANGPCFVKIVGLGRAFVWLGQVSTQIPCMAQHGGRSYLDDAQVGCPLGRRECQGTVCGKGKGGEEKQGAWYFCYLEMGFGLVKVLPVKQIKTWNPRADHGRLFSIFVR